MRYSNLLVGCRHATFGRCNIRTPLQQLRRQGDGYRRQLGWLNIERDRGQAESSRWLPYQDRQRMFVLCALHRDVRGEDSSGIELRLRLRDI